MANIGIFWASTTSAIRRNTPTLSSEPTPSRVMILGLFLGAENLNHG